MNIRNLVISLVATLLVVVAAGVYLLTSDGPSLGLDLQGGISAVYRPVIEGERPDDFSEILDETIEVIRQRVDSLGVAEPEISRQGDDVLVQLPGLEDADRAREIIGQTAELRFRRVRNVLFPGTPEYDAATACASVTPLGVDASGILCGRVDEVVDATLDVAVPPVKYDVGPAELTGAAITGAAPAFDGTGWAVTLDLDSDGAQAFATITNELACARDAGLIDQFAIVLDGVVESAPSMSANVACGVGIQGGEATITVGGNGADEQRVAAADLALVLRTGALPITLETETFETVSPTLGADSLDAGMLAGLGGLALVALYLIGFYRWLGVVAIVGLTSFGVLILAAVTLLGEVGFALTLAGIAGIIVSIGITADSSILYFERIRDEVAGGRTVRTAVSVAFRSAFRTNLAGNTVTLAAAMILYFLAIGPVRGFALTLGMSTVLDILLLWFYTRSAVGILGAKQFLKRSRLRVPDAASAQGGIR